MKGQIKTTMRYQLMVRTNQISYIASGNEKCSATLVNLAFSHDVEQILNATQQS